MKIFYDVPIFLIFYVPLFFHDFPNENNATGITWCKSWPSWRWRWLGWGDQPSWSMAVYFYIIYIRNYIYIVVYTCIYIYIYIPWILGIILGLHGHNSMELMWRCHWNDAACVGRWVFSNIMFFFSAWWMTRIQSDWCFSLLWNILEPFGHLEPRSSDFSIWQPFEILWSWIKPFGRHMSPYLILHLTWIPGLWPHTANFHYFFFTPPS